MKVCNEAHEAVVYSTPVCPVCMIISHFTEKVSDLNQRIEVLESDLKQADATIEEISLETVNA